MKTKHNDRGVRTAQADRNLQIIAAVRAGEAYQAIGDRLGLTGERVRQIATAAGERLGSSPKKCWCGRVLTPETDGNGKLIDACEKHGRNTTGTPADNPASSDSRPASRNGASDGNGKRCTAENCPGVLDDAATCKCCELRAQWERRNIPRPHCEICTGEITKGKFCLACKPLSRLALKLKRRKVA